MKHLKLLIVLAALLLSAVCQAGEAKITITIDSPTSYSFYVSHVENFFSDEEIGYMFNLNGNSHTFSLNLTTSKLVDIKYDQKTIRIFVSPGDAQQISFSGYDPVGTTRFSGSGSSNNTVLKNFQLQFPGEFTNRMYSNEYLPAIFNEEIVNQAGYLSESQYFSYIDDQKRQMKAALSSGSPDSRFRNFFNAWVDYEAAANKILYYHVNKHLFRGAEIASSASKYGVLSGVNINNESALNNTAYVKFLSTYIQYLNLSAQHNIKGIEFNFYELAKLHLQGKPRAFIISKLFFKTYRFGQTDLVQDHFKTFKQGNPYREYNTLLDETFGDSMQFAEEGFAPGFTLPDVNGRMVSLDQYRGKVVYLSFWATWCKPCLKGFEKSIYIRKKLQEKGIVLINISIDKKEEVWKGTMGRIEMPGVNLLASDDSMMKTYGLTSLPVYHIIDKQGKYAYLPEDGMRDIVEEFVKLTRK